MSVDARPRKAVLGCRDAVLGESFRRGDGGSCSEGGHGSLVTKAAPRKQGPDPDKRKGSVEGPRGHPQASSLPPSPALRSRLGRQAAAVGSKLWVYSSDPSTRKATRNVSSCRTPLHPSKPPFSRKWLLPPPLAPTRCVTSTETPLASDWNCVLRSAETVCGAGNLMSVK